MAGLKSLHKGKKGEKEFYDLCKENGLIVKRTQEDPVYPDMELEGHPIEVKYREAVPKCIYEWLWEKEAEMLAIKRISNKDKGYEWLIVITPELLFPLLKEKKW